MKEKVMTLEEIRTKGLDILAKKLGPVGLIRFLQQFETGNGDYTAERRELLKGFSVNKIAQRFGKRPLLRRAVP